MWRIPDNKTAGTSARKAGFEAGLDELRELLNTQWEIANETFMLFRENDSRYQDPRTDFTLGRRDAINDVIDKIRVMQASMDA